MSLPPRVTRKSIAGYAYELIEEDNLKPRTTSWVPEDGGFVKKVGNGAIAPVAGKGTGFVAVARVSG